MRMACAGSSAAARRAGAMAASTPQKDAMSATDRPVAQGSVIANSGNPSDPRNRRVAITLLYRKGVFGE